MTEIGELRQPEGVFPEFPSGGHDGVYYEHAAIGQLGIEGTVNVVPASVASFCSVEGRCGFVFLDVQHEGKIGGESPRGVRIARRKRDDALMLLRPLAAGMDDHAVSVFREGETVFLVLFQEAG